MRPGGLCSPSHQDATSTHHVAANFSTARHLTPPDPVGNAASSRLEDEKSEAGGVRVCTSEVEGEDEDCSASCNGSIFINGALQQQGRSFSSLPSSSRDTSQETGEMMASPEQRPLHVPVAVVSSPKTSGDNITKNVTQESLSDDQPPAWHSNISKTSTQVGVQGFPLPWKAAVVDGTNKLLTNCLSDAGTSSQVAASALRFGGSHSVSRKPGNSCNPRVRKKVSLEDLVMKLHEKSGVNPMDRSSHLPWSDKSFSDFGKHVKSDLDQSIVEGKEKEKTEGGKEIPVRADDDDGDAGPRSSQLNPSKMEQSKDENVKLNKDSKFISDRNLAELRDNSVTKSEESERVLENVLGVNITGCHDIKLSDVRGVSSEKGEGENKCLVNADNVREPEKMSGYRTGERSVEKESGLEISSEIICAEKNKELSESCDSTKVAAIVCETSEKRLINMEEVKTKARRRGLLEEAAGRGGSIPSDIAKYLEPISDDENSILCDSSGLPSTLASCSNSNTPMFSDTPSDTSCATLVKISDAVAAILSDISDDSLPESPTVSDNGPKTSEPNLFALFGSGSSDISPNKMAVQTLSGLSCRDNFLSDSPGSLPGNFPGHRKEPKSSKCVCDTDSEQENNVRFHCDMVSGVQTAHEVPMQCKDGTQPSGDCESGIHVTPECDEESSYHNKLSHCKCLSQESVLDRQSCNCEGARKRMRDIVSDSNEIKEKAKYFEQEAQIQRESSEIQTICVVSQDLSSQTESCNNFKAIKNEDKSFHQESLSDMEKDKQISIGSQSLKSNSSQKSCETSADQSALKANKALELVHYNDVTKRPDKTSDADDISESKLELAQGETWCESPRLKSEFRSSTTCTDSPAEQAADLECSSLVEHIDDHCHDSQYNTSESKSQELPLGRQLCSRASSAGACTHSFQHLQTEQKQLFVAREEETLYPEYHSSLVKDSVESVSSPSTDVGSKFVDASHSANTQSESLLENKSSSLVVHNFQDKDDQENIPLDEDCGKVTIPETLSVLCSDSDQDKFVSRTCNATNLTSEQSLEMVNLSTTEQVEQVACIKALEAPHQVSDNSELDHVVEEGCTISRMAKSPTKEIASDIDGSCLSSCTSELALQPLSTPESKDSLLQEPASKEGSECVSLKPSCANKMGVTSQLEMFSCENLRPSVLEDEKILNDPNDQKLILDEKDCITIMSCADPANSHSGEVDDPEAEKNMQKLQCELLTRWISDCKETELAVSLNTQHKIGDSSSGCSSKTSEFVQEGSSDWMKLDLTKVESLSQEKKLLPSVKEESLEFRPEPQPGDQKSSPILPLGISTVECSEVNVLDKKLSVEEECEGALEIGKGIREETRMECSSVNSPKDCLVERSLEDTRCERIDKLGQECVEVCDLAMASGNCSLEEDLNVEEQTCGIFPEHGEDRPTHEDSFEENSKPAVSKGFIDHSDGLLNQMCKISGAVESINIPSEKSVYGKQSENPIQLGMSPVKAASDIGVVNEDNISRTPTSLCSVSVDTSQDHYIFQGTAHSVEGGDGVLDGQMLLHEGSTSEDQVEGPEFKHRKSEGSSGVLQELTDDCNVVEGTSRGDIPEVPSLVSGILETPMPKDDITQGQSSNVLGEIAFLTEVPDRPVFETRIPEGPANERICQGTSAHEGTVSQDLMQCLPEGSLDEDAMLGKIVVHKCLPEELANKSEDSELQLCESGSSEETSYMTGSLYLSSEISRTELSLQGKGTQGYDKEETLEFTTLTNSSVQDWIPTDNSTFALLSPDTERVHCSSSEGRHENVIPEEPDVETFVSKVACESGVSENTSQFYGSTAQSQQNVEDKVGELQYNLSGSIESDKQAYEENFSENQNSYSLLQVHCNVGEQVERGITWQESQQEQSKLCKEQNHIYGNISTETLPIHEVEHGQNVAHFIHHTQKSFSHCSEGKCVQSKIGSSVEENVEDGRGGISGTNTPVSLLEKAAPQNMPEGSDQEDEIVAEGYSFADRITEESKCKEQLLVSELEDSAMNTSKELEDASVPQQEENLFSAIHQVIEQSIDIRRSSHDDEMKNIPLSSSPTSELGTDGEHEPVKDALAEEHGHGTCVEESLQNINYKKVPAKLECNKNPEMTKNAIMQEPMDNDIVGSDCKFINTHHHMHEREPSHIPNQEDNQDEICPEASVSRILSEKLDQVNNSQSELETRDEEGMHDTQGLMTEELGQKGASDESVQSNPLEIPLPCGKVQNILAEHISTNEGHSSKSVCEETKQEDMLGKASQESEAYFLIENRLDNFLTECVQEKSVKDSILEGPVHVDSGKEIKLWNDLEPVEESGPEELWQSIEDKRLEEEEEVQNAQDSLQGTAQEAELKEEPAQMIAALDECVQEVGLPRLPEQDDGECKLLHEVRSSELVAEVKPGPVQEIGSERVHESEFQKYVDELNITEIQREGELVRVTNVESQQEIVVGDEQSQEDAQRDSAKEVVPDDPLKEMTLVESHQEGVQHEQMESTWMDSTEQSTQVEPMNETTLVESPQETSREGSLQEVTQDDLARSEIMLEVSGGQPTPELESVELVPEDVHTDPLCQVSYCKPAAQDKSDFEPQATCSEPVDHGTLDELIDAHSEPLPQGLQNEPLTQIAQGGPIHQVEQSEPQPLVAQSEYMPQIVQNEPVPQVELDGFVQGVAQVEPVLQVAEDEIIPEVEPDEVAKEVMQGEHMVVGTQCTTEMELALSEPIFESAQDENMDCTAQEVLPSNQPLVEQVQAESLQELEQVEPSVEVVQGEPTHEIAQDGPVLEASQDIPQNESVADDLLEEPAGVQHSMEVAQAELLSEASQKDPTLEVALGESSFEVVESEPPLEATTGEHALEPSYGEFSLDTTLDESTLEHTQYEPAQVTSSDECTLDPVQGVPSQELSQGEPVLESALGESTQESAHCWVSEEVAEGESTPEFTQGEVTLEGVQNEVVLEATEDKDVEVEEGNPVAREKWESTLKIAQGEGTHSESNLELPHAEPTTEDFQDEPALGIKPLLGIAQDFSGTQHEDVVEFAQEGRTTPSSQEESTESGPFEEIVQIGEPGNEATQVGCEGEQTGHVAETELTQENAAEHQEVHKVEQEFKQEIEQNEVSLGEDMQEVQDAAALEFMHEELGQEIGPNEIPMNEDIIEVQDAPVLEFPQNVPTQELTQDVPTQEFVQDGPIQEVVQDELHLELAHNDTKQKELTQEYEGDESMQKVTQDEFMYVEAQDDSEQVGAHGGKQDMEAICRQKVSPTELPEDSRAEILQEDSENVALHKDTQAASPCNYLLMHHLQEVKEGDPGETLLEGKHSEIMEGGLTSSNLHMEIRSEIIHDAVPREEVISEEPLLEVKPGESAQEVGRGDLVQEVGSGDLEFSLRGDEGLESEHTQGAELVHDTAEEGGLSEASSEPLPRGFDNKVQSEEPCMESMSEKSVELVVSQESEQGSELLKHEQMEGLQEPDCMVGLEEPDDVGRGTQEQDPLVNSKEAAQEDASSGSLQMVVMDEHVQGPVFEQVMQDTEQDVAQEQVTGEINKVASQEVLPEETLQEIRNKAPVHKVQTLSVQRGVQEHGMEELEQRTVLGSAQEVVHGKMYGGALNALPEQCVENIQMNPLNKEMIPKMWGNTEKSLENSSVITVCDSTANKDIFENTAEEYQHTPETRCEDSVSSVQDDLWQGSQEQMYKSVPNEPLQNMMEAAVQEITAESVQNMADSMQDNSPRPVQKYMAESLQGDIAKHVQEYIMEPVQEYMTEPVKENMHEDVQQNMREALQENMGISLEENPVQKNITEVLLESEAEPMQEFMGDPVPEFTAEPVQEVTADPVQELTAEPVQEVMVDPMQEFTAEPAQEVMADPVQEFTAEPAQEVMVDPVPEFTAEPVQEVMADPVPEFTAEPMQEVTADPVQEFTVEPVQEVVAEPLQEFTAEPVQEVVAEPLQEFTAEPVQEVMADPVQEFTAQPLQEVVTEPEQDIMAEPEQEVMAEPEQEVMAEPVQDFIAEPVQELMTEPLEDVMPEPEQEVMAEPEGEFMVETVQEFTAESVQEVTAEPVQEVTAEPVQEVTTEPVQEVVAEPMQEVMVEPEQDVAAEFVHELTPEPLQEVMAEPVQEAAVEPVQEVTAEPMQEVMAEPVHEVMAEPVHEVQPLEEVMAEPVQEVMAEPVQEVTAEPVHEVQPLQEVMAEPVQEITAEPVQVVAEPEQEVQPLEEVMAEPVQEVMAEPVQEVTAEPLEEVTVEPLQEVMAEHVQEVMAEPVQEVVAEPVQKVMEEFVQEHSSVELEQESATQVSENYVLDRFIQGNIRDELLGEGLSEELVQRNMFEEPESENILEKYVHSNALEGQKLREENEVVAMQEEILEESVQCTESISVERPDQEIRSDLFPESLPEGYSQGDVSEGLLLENTQDQYLHCIVDSEPRRETQELVHESMKQIAVPENAPEEFLQNSDRSEESVHVVKPEECVQDNISKEFEQNSIEEDSVRGDILGKIVPKSDAQVLEECILEELIQNPEEKLVQINVPKRFMQENTLEDPAQENLSEENAHNNKAESLEVRILDEHVQESAGEKVVQETKHEESQPTSTSDLQQERVAENPHNDASEETVQKIILEAESSTVRGETSDTPVQEVTLEESDHQCVQEQLMHYSAVEEPEDETCEKYVAASTDEKIMDSSFEKKSLSSVAEFESEHAFYNSVEGFVQENVDQESVLEYRENNLMEDLTPDEPVNEFISAILRVNTPEELGSKNSETKLAQENMPDKSLHRQTMENWHENIFEEPVFEVDKGKDQGLNSEEVDEQAEYENCETKNPSEEYVQGDTQGYVQQDVPSFEYDNTSVFLDGCVTEGPLEKNRTVHANEDTSEKSIAHVLSEQFEDKECDEPIEGTPELMSDCVWSKSSEENISFGPMLGSVSDEPLQGERVFEHIPENLPVTVDQAQESMDMKQTFEHLQVEQAPSGDELSGSGSCLLEESATGKCNTSSGVQIGVLVESEISVVSKCDLSQGIENVLANEQALCVETGKCSPTDESQELHLQGNGISGKDVELNDTDPIDKSSVFSGAEFDVCLEGSTDCKDEIQANFELAALTSDSDFINSDLKNILEQDCVSQQTVNMSKDDPTCQGVPTSEGTGGNGPDSITNECREVIQCLCSDNSQNLSSCENYCNICDSTIETSIDDHLADFHICVTFIPAEKTDAYKHFLKQRVMEVKVLFNKENYKNESYVCATCMSSFSNVQAVLIHSNLHDNIYLVKASGLKCQCMKKLYASSLYRWKAILHTTTFVCFLCNYLFACESGLNSHVEVAHYFKEYCRSCHSSVPAHERLSHWKIHSENQKLDVEIGSKDITPKSSNKYGLSRNIVDNQLNYLDGKDFRLNTSNKVDDPQGDRSYLQLPVSNVPLEAQVPEVCRIEPEKDLNKYIKGKANIKVLVDEDNADAIRNFDLPLQLQLQKNLGHQLRKGSRLCGMSTRTVKDSDMLSVLRLQMVRTRSSKPDFVDLQPNKVMRTQGQSIQGNRCTRSKRAQQVEPSDEKYDAPTLTRTRSGMKPPCENYREESKIMTETLEEPGEVVVEGEWSSEHTYVCCACGEAYLDLGEMMDHKWEAHPSVWCAHTMIHGQAPVPLSFSLQYQPPAARPVVVPLPLSDANNIINSKNGSEYARRLTCSRCSSSFLKVEEFHLHLVECGGLASTSPSKKKSKRGFKFKRRKGQGIPVRHYGLSSHPGTPRKTKHGDGSGINTPLAENAATVASHAQGVKRRLELAIGSIDNTDLKNRLKAIISSSSSGANFAHLSRKTIRMKLRRKTRDKTTLRRSKRSEKVAEDAKKKGSDKDEGERVVAIEEHKMKEVPVESECGKEQISETLDKKTHKTKWKKKHSNQIKDDDLSVKVVDTTKSSDVSSESSQIKSVAKGPSSLKDATQNKKKIVKDAANVKSKTVKAVGKGKVKKNKKGEEKVKDLKKKAEKTLAQTVGNGNGTAKTQLKGKVSQQGAGTGLKQSGVSVKSSQKNKDISVIKNKLTAKGCDGDILVKGGGNSQVKGKHKTKGKKDNFTEGEVEKLLLVEGGGKFIDKGPSKAKKKPKKIVKKGEVLENETSFIGNQSLANVVEPALEVVSPTVNSNVKQVNVKKALLKKVTANLAKKAGMFSSAKGKKLKTTINTKDTKNSLQWDVTTNKSVLYNMESEVEQAGVSSSSEKSIQHKQKEKDGKSNLDKPCKTSKKAEREEAVTSKAVEWPSSDELDDDSEPEVIRNYRIGRRHIGRAGLRRKRKRHNPRYTFRGLSSDSEKDSDQSEKMSEDSFGFQSLEYSCRPRRDSKQVANDNAQSCHEDKRLGNPSEVENKTSRAMILPKVQGGPTENTAPIFGGDVGSANGNEDDDDDDLPLSFIAKSIKKQPKSLCPRSKSSSKKEEVVTAKTSDISAVIVESSDSCNADFVGFMANVNIVSQSDQVQSSVQQMKSKGKQKTKSKEVKAKAKVPKEKSLNIIKTKKNVVMPKKQKSNQQKDKSKPGRTCLPEVPRKSKGLKIISVTAEINREEPRMSNLEVVKTASQESKVDDKSNVEPATRSVKRSLDAADLEISCSLDKGNMDTREEDGICESSIDASPQALTRVKRRRSSVEKIKDIPTRASLQNQSPVSANILGEEIEVISAVEPSVVESPLHIAEDVSAVVSSCKKKKKVNASSSSSQGKSTPLVPKVASMKAKTKAKGIPKTIKKGNKVLDKKEVKSVMTTIEQPAVSRLVSEKVKQPKKKKKTMETKALAEDLIKCMECGLRFDTHALLEEHQQEQDCVNIAFEMSLMEAEDHLFECPHCHLTFAYKGTQRKHTSSCRAVKYKRVPQRSDGKVGHVSKLTKGILLPSQQQQEKVAGPEDYPGHLPVEENCEVQDKNLFDMPSKKIKIPKKRKSTDVDENLSGTNTDSSAPGLGGERQIHENMKVKTMGSKKVKLSSRGGGGGGGGALVSKSHNKGHHKTKKDKSGSSSEIKSKKSKVNGENDRPSLTEQLSSNLASSWEQWCPSCDLELPDLLTATKHQLYHKFTSKCQQRPVLEVCMLLVHYGLSVEQIRQLITTAISYQGSTILDLSTNGGLLSSEELASSAKDSSLSQEVESLQKSGSASGPGATLQELLSSPVCVWVNSVMDTIAQKQTQRDAVCISGNRQEALKAVTTIEEVLKELLSLDIFVKKNNMLLSMRQTFEAGTED